MKFIVQSQSSNSPCLNAKGLNAQSSNAIYSAIVYRDINYGGPSQQLAVGRYNLQQLSIGNDAISSVRIPDGVSVTLYEHADFQGQKLVLNQDTPYVGDNFNDKASSIVVELAAEIYEHANYQGNSQTLLMGSYDIGQLTIGNDKLSSLKVPPGLTVTLFEHANFQGRIKTFTQDTPYVGDDFNDITSAVIVSLAEVEIPDTALKYGDKISLKSSHGGYLSAVQDGNLNANGSGVGDCQKFVITRSGNSTNNVFVSFGDIVSLKSCYDRYLVAEADGSADAGAPAITNEVKFTLYRSGNTQNESFFCTGDIISLKSNVNKYVVAESDGTVNANRDAIGDWEKWTISVTAGDNPVVTPQTLESTACGADACGAAACAAAAYGASACGAAAYGIIVCGAAACAADACRAAACAADVCGGQACGGAACGGAICTVATCGGDACGGYAGGIAACPADACGANVCGINACPCDACAADACAIDIIPIIPGI